MMTKCHNAIEYPKQELFMFAFDIQFPQKKKKKISGFKHNIKQNYLPAIYQ